MCGLLSVEEAGLVAAADLLSFSGARPLAFLAPACARADVGAPAFHLRDDRGVLLPEPRERGFEPPGLDEDDEAAVTHARRRREREIAPAAPPPTPEIGDDARPAWTGLT